MTGRQRRTIAGLRHHRADPNLAAAALAEPGRIRPDTRAPGILSWIPGVGVLRHYQRDWLKHDVSAGIVLTTMLIPVGMAYAQAAGLPAILGLYATIVPLLAYFVFGPSRIMVLGPDSSLAPMIAVVILPLAAGNTERAIALGGMLALMSGAICVLFGLAKLGFITDLLSKPIHYGYLNGIAVTVFVSQLPKLFGFPIEADNLLPRVEEIAQAITTGMMNKATTALGLGSLAVILLLKRWKRIPGILLAVMAATLAVALFDLAVSQGVSVVGPLPHGVPEFKVPLIQQSDLVPLLAGAVAIVVVSFADTSVLSRAYAIKTRSYVDPNREMVGLGMANLAAGLFQGFPISSSASRTPVAEAAGARTQLTGVVGALCIVVLLVGAPGLTRDLPEAALAAVMISAAIGLVDWQGMGQLYRRQRWEFWLSIICFAGVALIGPIPGILLAIGLAVVEFLWEGWRPHHAILGRVEGARGYHDIVRYPDARRVPGLLLFRWDAPLFFANAGLFRTKVLATIAESTTPVHWINISAAAVSNIDTTAADMLEDLEHELHDAGIQLSFSAMKGPAKDKLRRYGLYDGFDARGAFYYTIDEAVADYLQTERVDWVDWEQQRGSPTRAAGPSSSAEATDAPESPLTWCTVDAATRLVWSAKTHTTEGTLQPGVRYMVVAEADGLLRVRGDGVDGWAPATSVTVVSGEELGR